MDDVAAKLIVDAVKETGAKVTAMGDKVADMGEKVATSTVWSKSVHATVKTHIRESKEWKEGVEKSVKEIKCPLEKKITEILSKGKWKNSLIIRVILYITATGAIVSIVWSVLRIIPALKELGG